MGDAQYLDQPIIIIGRNLAICFHQRGWGECSCLFCFDRTLRDASKAQQEATQVRFDRLSRLLAVYFSYLSISVLFSSYISQSMLQLGSLVVFIGLVLLVYGFRKVSFLGSKNTRFQAPRFWLPVGHRSSDLSHHFRNHPRHLTVDATSRFQCLGACGNYYSRFSFSIILSVAEFSQQHQRLHHEKFLS